MFAFDYESSGKLDHIFFCRPGHGIAGVLQNRNGTFVQVELSTSGIARGVYDLLDEADQVFAFDYDHSGKLDHIVAYRPGHRAFYIFKSQNRRFVQRFGSASGIGGYDVADSADRAFAFDYENSGRLDYIAIYRPGRGKQQFWILGHVGSDFGPTNKSSSGENGPGIASYPLDDARDRAIAFDYDHSGKMDHIVLCRPGTGVIWIVKNKGGTFSKRWPIDAHLGIDGWDLRDQRDILLAFDYEGSGKNDYLGAYRPGTAFIRILLNDGGRFVPVYQPRNGPGIGGYDLRADSDRVFSFDYSSTGISNYLVLYRPGYGVVFIVKKQ
jgi:hypothetical protein